MGCVEAYELEVHSCSTSRWVGVNGEMRESEEGNGRVKLRDTIDVRVNRSVVEISCGEKDGDGERIRMMMKKKLA